MGVQAVKALVPLLVAEPTVPPSRAHLVPVVGVIHAALTAIKPCKPHLQLLLLSGTSAHGNIIKVGALHTMQGSRTACSAPFTSLSTELAGM